MADRLTALLQRFDLRAQVLHTGAQWGVLPMDMAVGSGHLHLLQQGRLRVFGTEAAPLVLEAPSLLFLPRARSYRLDAGPQPGAVWVSAGIDFGQGEENPLLRALPAQLVVPFARMPALAPVLQLLFGEVRAQRCGHDAAINRLIEVLMIQLLRHTIEQRLVQDGLIAGLSDARLHRTLSAVHAQPSRSWTLSLMADEAGLSRARFASLFTERIGIPPGEYLKRWRLGLARTLMRRGMPLKQVAAEVGYANASALSRAFTQHVGTSPTAWQRADGNATLEPAGTSVSPMLPA